MDQQTGILINEKGILEKDGIYFAMTSPFSRENLFYPMFCADYTCDIPYHVSRRADSFNAFFLCFILDGEMRFEYRDTTFTANKNSVIFLNCKYSHTYTALRRTRFYWFHFGGPACAAYAEKLWNIHPGCFSDLPSFEVYFSQIHNIMRTNNVQEDLLSVAIHRILAQLATYHEPIRNMTDAVSAAKYYIEKNYMENISLDTLSEISSLSKYHLSREFRKSTGYSPHEYLINVRLEEAKRMLSSTADSVESIAFSCAFCSSANFIRTFRKKTGITPNKFRELVSSSG